MFDAARQQQRARQVCDTISDAREARRMNGPRSVHPRWFRARIAALLAGLLLLKCAAIASAATGDLIALPDPKMKPSPSGLSLTVDTRWVNGYGYRPIRVTVTSPTPTQFDQTITFRLKAGDWSNTPHLSLDQDIEFPAGGTMVEAIVAAPQLEFWQKLWWDVLIDGEFDEALSIDQHANPANLNVSSWVSDESLPRVLFVHGKKNQATAGGATPLLQELAKKLGEQVNGGGRWNPGRPNGEESISITIDGNSISVNNDFAQAATDASMSLPIGDLPTRWIDYSALDLICLHRDDLANIQKDNPAALRAITQWVAAGGGLWVYDAADDWSDLAEIEQNVGMIASGARPNGDENANEDVTLEEHGWRPIGQMNARRRDDMGGMMFNTPMDERKLLSRGAFRVAWRPFEMGTLFASNKSFGGVSEVHALICVDPRLRAIGWVNRHGLQPNLPNAEFGNFLIPGVGEAPVTEFQILITLFVILIGPINYWLLKRWGRLYLLVLTVPLAALAVTLALFGYALVADGLSTRIRARSLTMLDQTRDSAVCWARLSYYAGLAPSSGLTFPDDIAIYPIRSSEMSGLGYSRRIPVPERSMQWAGEQFLTIGWLNSRTPTQYMTVRSGDSKRELTITSTTAKGAEIKNNLGAEVATLILRGDDGGLYQGQAIGPGDTARLEVVSEADAANVLRRLFNENEPAFPFGATGPAANAFNGPNRRRQMGPWYANVPGGSARLSDSLLARGLARFLTPDPNQKRAVNLESREYIAITSAAPEVDMGVSTYTEEASFHVVHGRW